jgi:hypothetical protein
VNVWLAVALFFIGAVTDLFWVRWNLRANARQAFRSANWAVLICLPAMVCIPAYATDRLYVLPYAAGAWVGTWWTVEKEK